MSPLSDFIIFYGLGEFTDEDLRFENSSSIDGYKELKLTKGFKEFKIVSKRLKRLTRRRIYYATIMELKDMIVYDIEPKWFSRPYVDLLMILTHIYSGIDPLNKNHKWFLHNLLVGKNYYVGSHSKRGNHSD